MIDELPFFFVPVDAMTPQHVHPGVCRFGHVPYDLDVGHGLKYVAFTCAFCRSLVMHRKDNFTPCVRHSFANGKSVA
jgi:hypothetical protein